MIKFIVFTINTRQVTLKNEGNSDIDIIWTNLGDIILNEILGGIMIKETQHKMVVV